MAGAGAGGWDGILGWESGGMAGGGNVLRGSGAAGQCAVI
jgi:hypothetical protein